MLFVPEGTKDTGNEISKYSIVGMFWLKKRKRRSDGLKQKVILKTEALMESCTAGFGFN